MQRWLFWCHLQQKCGKQLINNEKLWTSDWKWMFARHSSPFNWKLRPQRQLCLCLWLYTETLDMECILVCIHKINGSFQIEAIKQTKCLFVYSFSSSAVSILVDTFYSYEVHEHEWQLELVDDGERCSWIDRGTRMNDNNKTSDPSPPAAHEPAIRRT